MTLGAEGKGDAEEFGFSSGPNVVWRSVGEGGGEKRREGASEGAGMCDQRPEEKKRMTTCSARSAKDHATLYRECLTRSKSWYDAALIRLTSTNCCKSMSRKLIGETAPSRSYGPHGAQAFTERCLEARASKGAYLSMPPLLHDPSCQLLRDLPHPPPSPTLRPFSTPPWNLTIVKPRKT